MNQKLKAVGTAIAMTSVLAIYGCSNDNKPTPPPTMPAPSASQSVEISEAPTPPQITRNGSGPAIITEEPTRDNPQPKETTEAPAPKPTISSDAGTPATQFAGRWGKRYPEVPEFAILKAANATCKLIEKSGADWINDELLKSSVGASLELAGMQYNDAVEFAQDAEQNYCSSVSNPT